jgi:hypothetical protein
MNMLEQDWDRAINPNGKQAEHLMPDNIKQMMRVFFYMGWCSGAGRVMEAGRSLDDTTQMMRVMEIMDCIENDERFLGVPSQDLVSTTVGTPPTEH